MPLVYVDGAAKLRQRITTTHSFTGIRTAHGDGVGAPVVTSNSMTYDELDDDGEGLFEAGSLSEFAWGVQVHYVQLLVGEGTSWQIYRTSGDRDGSSTTVDDPDRDILLAQGASDYSWAPERLLLSRKSCIRVVTTAVTRAGGGEIEVYFTPQRGPRAGIYV